MDDLNYSLLADQAAADRQSANVRYRKALRDSQHYAFSELVFTAAAADIAEVRLEPSDQGDYMTTQAMDIDDEVIEALDEPAMDLADTVHSYWATLPGVLYESSRRMGDTATINIKLAVEALIAPDDERDHAETEPKPMTHVDFARQWLAWDDRGDDSDSLHTEARWEFERVVKENERPPLFAHFDEVCEEAGLGVMVQVYEIVSDRGDVEESTLLALTAEDVTNHYYRVGAGIDDVERSLRAKEEDARIIRKYDNN